jgi:hypothetical protein
MTLQTTHNDHLILYYEHNDEWKCASLDLSAKTLSALKTKINDFDAKERRLGKGVVLIHVGGRRYYSGQMIAPKVRATMLDKNDLEKYPTVWISHLEGGQREKVGLHSLIVDTPENVAVLVEADRLEKEAKALEKKAEKMRADIKRVSVEEIKAMALAVKPE